MAHFTGVGAVIGCLALRWIATALFGVSIATYTYILVAQHRRWPGTVTHLLHLTMSAAMILMAWHVGMGFPTVAPMLFFGLATVWFLCMAGPVSCAGRDRVTHGYNALVMAAMAWMYLVMNGTINGHAGHTQAAMSGMSGMSGMQMPSAPHAAEWIMGVNWIATVGFAVLALYWAYRYLTTRQSKPTAPGAQLAHSELLGQLFTAAGTGLMFGVLL